MAYKILLASNVPILLKGLSIIANEILQNDVTIQTEAGIFSQLEYKIEKQRTQLLIIDVETIKGIDLQVFQLLILKFPLLKIMVLFEQMDKSLFKALFLLGINGIINKTSSINSLTTSMRKICTGDIYVENELLLEYLDTATQQKFQIIKYNKLRLLVQDF